MADAETVSFPQNRTCPYHPPTEYRSEHRGQQPVSPARLFDGRTVWLVTGHTEARSLLVDQRLSSDRENPAFPFFAERLAGTTLRRVELLGVDDPEHNVQRRMLIPSFTVRRTAALRPRIQETVDRLLDTMVEQGPPADLVDSFALPVPSMVICALLGVPYDDHEFFEAQSRKLLRGPKSSDVEAARDALDEYFRVLIERKRATPGEGLLDELIANQLESGAVDHDELVRLAQILLIAGHETTANMISLGTFTLLQHPDQLARMRESEGLMASAVEELLRFLSIADGISRVAVDDIEVGGVTIRAGDGVILTTSVINRDGNVYAHPDDLDLGRNARNHVAFGFGVHQCLGQNLARAELEIALPALFDRLPDLRLAVPAEEIPFKPGDTIQGLLEMPVTW
ncbi:MULTISPECIES: cytochrome P450 [unclassified Streptomyces]|uniref:cytochrome P450 n=1 Tax=unclassified Streptomyces TaxID=2593676 RepID=UPI00081AF476|nr:MULTISPECIES: cytochrome P450 [unclassified Streptomyces]MYQ83878.1 cytochrome P450 [Streptomyces sp. SID4936]SCD74601.1 pentalenic acid synthase [Streptomyces sp. DvalAA-43]